MSPKLRLVVFAATLAAVFLVVLALVARSPEEIQRSADEAGAWAPVAYLALCTGLTLAFFPFPLLAAASGVLFGTAEGTALSTVGSTIGAVLAFLIARHAASGAVESLIGERLRGVQDAVARRGFVAVLYARIFPGVPRDAANYAFGLTRVTLVAFTTATVIGVIPRAFAYTALGGSLGDFDSTESIVAISTLAAMGVLGLVLVRRDVLATRGAAGA
ncbi:MAG: TVP38/TMEM64 family protein [Solirubrobacterales bacterium]|nr:TVP38/TMEM64 family protein [Solirubrobacterales bacterium]